MHLIIVVFATRQCLVFPQSQRGERVQGKKKQDVTERTQSFKQTKCILCSNFLSALCYVSDSANYINLQIHFPLPKERDDPISQRQDWKCMHTCMYTYMQSHVTPHPYPHYKAQCLVSLLVLEASNSSFGCVTPDYLLIDAKSCWF